ncbi:MAG: S46 family peptidase, partial [Proteobacteria bacterium]|nr:S46 family peptidase [Pseudomonadota bacterium]
MFRKQFSLPLALAVSLFTFANPAEAREGMWLPSQLPHLAGEMEELGAEFTPNDLKNLEEGPLASVVDLDNCSGAFVSEDGLIATAFHCVWDALLFASSDDENLVESGFYAETLKDERWAGPAAKIRITLEQKDVTNDVNSGTKRLEGKERSKKVDANTKSLVRRCESQEGVHCEVV